MYHFIISDKNNVKRREHIINEFQKIGVEPNFSNAIIGRSLSKEELEAVRCDMNYLTAGEIGCVLSHKKVLEKFLESAYKSVIIFEDDILFSDDLTHDILEDLENLVGDMEDPSVLSLYTTEIIYGETLKLRSIGINSTPRFMRSHGYIINRNGAELILKLQTPIKFEYDQFKFYHYLKGCKLYSLDINCVFAKESQFESSIGFRTDQNINDTREKSRKSNIKKLISQLTLYEKWLYHKRRIKKHLKSKVFQNYKDCVK